MAIDGVSAVGAVGKSLDIGATSAGGRTSATTTAEGTSFADAVGKAFNDAVGVVQSGEAAAIQGLQGDLPPYKVVDAIMSAQRTLQSMLSIRDKAISAYQEISRMAI